MALFNLSTCYHKMGDEQKASEYYERGVAALEREDDYSLKENFKMTDRNIGAVRSSVGEYQRVKN